MRPVSLAVVLVIAAAAAAVIGLSSGGHARAAATQHRAIAPHAFVIPAPGSTCYVGNRCSITPCAQFVAPDNVAEAVPALPTPVQPPRQHRLHKRAGRALHALAPSRRRCLPAGRDVPVSGAQIAAAPAQAVRGGSAR